METDKKRFKKRQDLLVLSNGLEEQVIRKEFTVAEINAMKDELTNDSIENNRLATELDKIKGEYKILMAPLQKNIKEKLDYINAGYEDVKMKVHAVPDDEKRTIEWYDEDGIYMGSRPMRRDETQKRMHLRDSEE